MFFVFRRTVAFGTFFDIKNDRFLAWFCIDEIDNRLAAGALNSMMSIHFIPARRA